MTTPPPTDPNELWEVWLAETDEQYRTPQSAMAFAVDRLTSHPAQGAQNRSISPEAEMAIARFESATAKYDDGIHFEGADPVADFKTVIDEVRRLSGPAEVGAEAPQVWEQIGWLRDYDQDGEEITEICSEGDPGAYVVYRGMPPSPSGQSLDGKVLGEWEAAIAEAAERINALEAELASARSGQNTDDKPGGWKEAFSLYHPDHGLNVSTVQVSREQAQNLIDTHPKDGKWQVVKVEVRIAPMRDTYAILYKPGTPTLPEALAKIKRLTAALTALRDAVKNEPSMQGRRFVGLGIQVNDALGDTPPSSPQSPAGAADVLERIAAANLSDPATDDLTVPLAIQLAETQAENGRLKAQVSEARDALALADKMLSEHIEEFHDFDYQPHEVPPELAQLRQIEHHLMGSLILDEDIPRAASPTQSGGADGR